MGPRRTSLGSGLFLSDGYSERTVAVYFCPTGILETGKNRGLEGSFLSGRQVVANRIRNIRNGTVLSVSRIAHGALQGAPVDASFPRLRRTRTRKSVDASFPRSRRTSRCTRRRQFPPLTAHTQIRRRRPPSSHDGPGAAPPVHGAVRRAHTHTKTRRRYPPRSSRLLLPVLRRNSVWSERRRNDPQTHLSDADFSTKNSSSLTGRRRRSKGGRCSGVHTRRTQPKCPPPPNT